MSLEVVWRYNTISDTLLLKFAPCRAGSRNSECTESPSLPRTDDTVPKPLPKLGGRSQLA